jgi:hypothetical protein
MVEVQNALELFEPKGEEFYHKVDGSYMTGAVKLIRAFSTLSLPHPERYQLRKIFGRLHIYNQPFITNQKEEIELACNYLLGIQDKEDVERSSRWFREMGSLQKRHLLEKGGLKSVRDLDSTLVANYLKELLRTGKFSEDGVVVEPVQLLLLYLLNNKQVIDDHEAKAASALLNCSKDRLDILRKVSQVGYRVLKECKIDSMSPSALGRILSVTTEKNVSLALNPDHLKLKQLYDGWAKVWGTIICCRELFLFENNNILT